MSSVKVRRIGVLVYLSLASQIWVRITKLHTFFVWVKTCPVFLYHVVHVVVHAVVSLAVFLGPMHLLGWLHILEPLQRSHCICLDLHLFRE